jgi:hypothetical protein
MYGVSTIETEVVEWPLSVDSAANTLPTARMPQADAVLRCLVYI